MKDKIFADGEFAKGSFRFNDEVASVFDDMAGRSIPYYKDVIEIIGQAALNFIPSKGSIYDLGCSTGNTLIYLAKILSGRKVKLTGLDPAEAMLQKAKEKAGVFTYGHDINFEQGFIENYDFKDADMVILNYTLQFINVDEREKVMKKIYNSLKAGGILIFSEKIKQEDDKVDNFNTEIYNKFKKNNGYSFLEIANKRQALENILVPESLSGNMNLLNKSGFSRSEILFKWLNFTTIMAFK